jgi:hypothetical protein
MSVKYIIATRNRKRALATLGNGKTSLSGIASITIDTVSFYSHVRHLRRNDKFACRHEPRNPERPRGRISSQFFVIHVALRDTWNVVYNDTVRQIPNEWTPYNWFMSRGQSSSRERKRKRIKAWHSRIPTRMQLYKCEIQLENAVCSLHSLSCESIRAHYCPCVNSLVSRKLTLGRWHQTLQI